MKRIIAVLCLMLGMAYGAATVSAHAISLIAAVSMQGNQMTVRLLDPYGAKLEGGSVTGTAALTGGESGKAFPLAEGPAGTYQGNVTPAPPAGKTFDVEIQAQLGPDLFRAVLPSRVAGEDSPELLLPMMPVEPQQGFNWGPVLYLAAVVVLLTATAVAVLRRRAAGDEAE
jgi:hypothetical protein